MVLQMSMAAIYLLKSMPSGLDTSPNEPQPPYRNVIANGVPLCEQEIECHATPANIQHKY